MSENTGEKQANGRLMPPKETRFGAIRGNRINRLGRPKSFDALRKLAQRIAAEELDSVDGETITRIEALLRVLSSSRNPHDRKTFLEYAYGKPKEQVDIAGSEGLKVIIEYANRDDKLAAPASGTAEDQK